MARLSLPVWGAWFIPRNSPTDRARLRRSRHRLLPGAEVLEIRDCPSGLTLSPEVHPQARVSLSADRTMPLSLIHQDRHHSGTPLRKLAHEKALARRPMTIYVKSGKSASHSLGSLAAAINRAKPGTTIILGPGVYSQNVLVKNKSNIIIMGSGESSTILAPANNNAIRVLNSNNIEIENLWLRSQGSQGRGLAVEGSSVTIQNIQTAGTYGDGVVVTGNAGRPGVLNATSSQFNSTQIGSGLELDAGALANINDSTFNDNGTSPAATQTSNGMTLFGNAQANITNSYFEGNTNEGMVAADQTQVTVQGSVFSSNQNGNGALFFSQATVNLSGNMFESNGAPNAALQLGGVEFYGVPNDPSNYTGAAVISGNVFLNNTLYGIYVGSASQAIQILNNQFENNVIGIFLSSLHLSIPAAPVNAIIQGNTIEVPAPASDLVPKGIIGWGSEVTATIGGPGAQGNTLENFDYSATAPNVGVFIYESGGPQLAILANTFTSGGNPVPEPNAVHIG
jgi:Periplasmic copper-binding protein (NosD)